MQNSEIYLKLLEIYRFERYRIVKILNFQNFGIDCCGVLLQEAGDEINIRHDLSINFELQNQ